ncbi:terminase [Zhihengliuella sp.]|uniref:terminase n=1 Tax=Zhihengliuella sp. TaxID=1954483 RepID=UPI0028121F9E|nr:terminase [Zhihengliuella sp.]
MRICLGFDGSDKNDFTCIRAETVGGWQFTPTYGPDKRPTIWDPAEYGGRIPRAEVDAAVEELFEVHDVERMYCDPPLWKTEVEGWALKYGEERVIQWETYRLKPMHAALERFIVDLNSGSLTHDDCAVTALHVSNAKMFARTGQKYIVLKPSEHQKIDAAVTSVLAHEAACDARAAGWSTAYQAPKGISTAAYGFN